MDSVREGMQQQFTREKVARAQGITGHEGPLGRGNFLATGREEFPFSQVNTLVARQRTAGSPSFRRETPAVGSVPPVDRGFSGAVVLRGETHKIQGI
jgi:hypothetical protein